MVFLQTSDAPLFPLTVTAHKIRPEYFQSRACCASIAALQPGANALKRGETMKRLPAD